MYTNYKLLTTTKRLRVNGEAWIAHLVGHFSHLARLLLGAHIARWRRVRGRRLCVQFGGFERLGHQLVGRQRTRSGRTMPAQFVSADFDATAVGERPLLANLQPVDVELAGTAIRNGNLGWLGRG